MLKSVNINDIKLTRIYYRRFFQSREYPSHEIQTGQSDFTEYSIDKKIINLENGKWFPKRILTSLIPHLVKLMEKSVMVDCIYSFSLYQKPYEYIKHNMNDCDCISKYIEVIFKFEDEPGTAKRLITEVIKDMDDHKRSYEEEEGEIILNIFRSEIFFKNESPYRFNLTVYKEDNCVICMDKKPNILFYNCGHLIICESCYKSYNDEECPKCRKVNDHVKLIL